MKPKMAVLRGGLAEALGHDKDAIDAYRFAAISGDRQASAEARLSEPCSQKRGEIGQAELLRELETLSAMWRGDTIEMMTLNRMARSTPMTGRYAELSRPPRPRPSCSPMPNCRGRARTRRPPVRAALLSPKGEDMKPVDALAMFYEYRELTPIGRRGDEMIRRLAERLAAVDLLDQAAELLQYQVDKRLEGAARAQVRRGWPWST